MAEIGRLNRESNPVPGEKPGFTPQYIGNDGRGVDVTPNTPYPTTDKAVAQKLDELKSSTQNVKDVDVKAELESLKQQQTNDNQAILTKLAALETKLNGTLNTQVTGSKVEYVRKSTDPRPEGKANDSLFLWDTRKLLLHDGTDWREV